MPQSTAFGRNDAALMTPAFAAVEYPLTAGAGSDNVAQTSAVLDLQTAFGTTRFGSAVLVLSASATLAAAATLTLKDVRFEHSDDNATFTDVEPGVVALTLTGPGGGGTVTGTVDIDCNLHEAKRYIRARWTPDLSAANTDTAKVASVFVLTNPTAI